MSETTRRSSTPQGQPSGGGGTAQQRTPSLTRADRELREPEGLAPAVVAAWLKYREDGELDWTRRWIRITEETFDTYLSKGDSTPLSTWPLRDLLVGTVGGRAIRLVHSDIVYEYRCCDDIQFDEVIEALLARAPHEDEGPDWEALYHELLERYNQLERSMRSLKESKDTHVVELEKQCQLVQDLKFQLSTAEDRHEEERRRLRAQAEADRLNLQNQFFAAKEEHQAQQENWERESSAQRGTIQHLEGTVADLETTLEKIRRELHDVKQELKEKDRKVQEQRIRIAEIEPSMEQAQRDLAALQQKYDAEMKKRTATDSDNARNILRLETAVSDAQLAELKAKTEVTELREKIRRHEENRAKRDAELRAREDKILILEENVRKLMLPIPSAAVECQCDLGEEQFQQILATKYKPLVPVTVGGTQTDRCSLFLDGKDADSQTTLSGEVIRLVDAQRYARKPQSSAANQTLYIGDVVPIEEARSWMKIARESGRMEGQAGALAKQLQSHGLTPSLAVGGATGTASTGADGHSTTADAARSKNAQPGTGSGQADSSTNSKPNSNSTPSNGTRSASQHRSGSQTNGGTATPAQEAVPRLGRRSSSSSATSANRSGSATGNGTESSVAHQQEERANNNNGTRGASSDSGWKGTSGGGSQREESGSARGQTSTGDVGKDRTNSKAGATGTGNTNLFVFDEATIRREADEARLRCEQLLRRHQRGGSTVNGESATPGSTTGHGHSNQPPGAPNSGSGVSSTTGTGVAPSGSTVPEELLHMAAQFSTRSAALQQLHQQVETAQRNAEAMNGPHVSAAVGQLELMKEVLATGRKDWILDGATQGTLRGQNGEGSHTPGPGQGQVQGQGQAAPGIVVGLDENKVPNGANRDRGSQPASFSGGSGNGTMHTEIGDNGSTAGNPKNTDAKSSSGAAGSSNNNGERGASQGGSDTFPAQGRSEGRPRDDPSPARESPSANKEATPQKENGTHGDGLVLGSNSALSSPATANRSQSHHDPTRDRLLLPSSPSNLSRALGKPSDYQQGSNGSETARLLNFTSGSSHRSASQLSAPADRQWAAGNGSRQGSNNALFRDPASSATTDNILGLDRSLASASAGSNRVIPQPMRKPLKGSKTRTQRDEVDPATQWRRVQQVMNRALSSGSLWTTVQACQTLYSKGDATFQGAQGAAARRVCELFNEIYPTIAERARREDSSEWEAKVHLAIARFAEYTHLVSDMTQSLESTTKMFQRISEPVARLTNELLDDEPWDHHPLGNALVNKGMELHSAFYLRTQQDTRQFLRHNQAAESIARFALSLKRASQILSSVKGAEMFAAEFGSNWPIVGELAELPRRMIVEDVAFLKLRDWLLTDNQITRTRLKRPTLPMR